MDRMISLWDLVIALLERMGGWFPQLMLRLVLAWEFWGSGVAKLNGQNWFAGKLDDFPFPFNILPADFSWVLASWTEALGAAGLVLGLATRFFSGALIIFLVVAAMTMHWPEQWNSLGELWLGYAITDTGHGNFKLPLLLLLMLLPLFFNGPGKASVDHFLDRMRDR